MRGHNFRILIDLLAANAGIAQPQCVFVLLLGIPCCLTTLLQERGRLVRVAGMTGAFSLYLDWSMWVILLVLVIVAPSKSTIYKTTNNQYVNTTIEAQTPERRRLAARTSPTNNVDHRPLTASKNWSNLVATYDGMVSTVNFLFMSDWGCLHLWLE